MKTTAEVSMGMELRRRQMIDVDMSTLPPEYFTRVPDFGKIRAALANGEAVPGAALNGRNEYVLRPMRRPKGN